MFSTSIYVSAVWLVLLVSSSLTLELIELNDANKNLLHLEDSKALEVVQSALTHEFKFNKVVDALKFVIKCNRLEDSFKDKNDDEFQGLAGKIKTLLRDERLQSLCKIKTRKFDDYAYLDEQEKSTSYLSTTKLNSLIASGQKLEQDQKMKQVLGHLFAAKTKNTGKQLLEHAVEDTSILFGELDSRSFLSTKYLTGCRVSLIKPICKLVRGVAADDVTAYGNDLAEFREALASNDQATISKRSSASRIDVVELKDHCKAIEDSLHPIDQVYNYLRAGFLSESEIKEQIEKDSEFQFYTQLKSLCEVQL